ncbi:MAG: glycosyltransferase family 4 protein [Hyphomicrobiaceae bacterium]
MDNSGGGGERVLADVASGLAARGHDVVVLSYDRPGGRSYYSLDPRIERIQLGIGSTTAPATMPVTLRRMFALRKSIRAKAPDVVIGFMHSMFIPLGLALMGTSIPMIASEHIVPEHYRSRPIQALLLRLTPYLSSCITCVSKQAREAYPRSLQTKMVVVPNPVTLNPTGRSDVAGSHKARKMLLSVGRLEPQKDHATLIEAFAEIASEVPDWDLRIIGEGQLRSQLESMVAEFGLESRVELPGGSNNIAAEYLSAQLFVLSSRYESFGLTTVEALAHGLPAIGFDDCPGTNQLIRPGINGDLANGSGRRSTALAKSLKVFMQDADLRVRLSANLDGVPDEFHIDKICGHWEETLGEVIRNGQDFHTRVFC